MNAGQCCSLTIDSWPFGEGRSEGSGNVALRLVESRKHYALLQLLSQNRIEILIERERHPKLRIAIKARSLVYPRPMPASHERIERSAPVIPQPYFLNADAVERHL